MEISRDRVHQLHTSSTGWKDWPRHLTLRQPKDLKTSALRKLTGGITLVGSSKRVSQLPFPVRSTCHVSPSHQLDQLSRIIHVPSTLPPLLVPNSTPCPLSCAADAEVSAVADPTAEST